ncbi:uncharacterized protein LOC120000624 [Tripterygium wilfordii]|uniref:uncharacterized protein LOC120000624 n=1 Tax=Tripterygium wilfordii TaxID=458696 RepID=UPI0018F819FD|nr:uncharacterized protein LOC120000624 [Tripterygium wilfordii]
MSAIESVFPNAKHLLCHWHINKNILAKCKKMFLDKETWNLFMSVWGTVVAANTEVEYLRRINELTTTFSHTPTAVAYVFDTWLNPYKERFIAAWTNNCMHFDNLTTKRVESAHAKLKKQLGCSLGNFDSLWSKIHSLLELHFTEIKASFEKSATVVQHKESWGITELCGCLNRRIHGLPCAHELAHYVRDEVLIPLSALDTHWKRLHIIPRDQPQIPDFILELNRFVDKIMKEDSVKWPYYARKIREIFDPNTTHLVEPKEKVKTRGRLSKKDKSTRRKPSAFELVDVPCVDMCIPSSTQNSVASACVTDKIQKKRVKKISVRHKLQTTTADK